MEASELTEQLPGFARATSSRLRHSSLRRTSFASYFGEPLVQQPSHRILRGKWFDRIVLVFITLNCIALCAIDPTDTSNKTTRNKSLQYVEYVFTVIFLFEAIARIYMQGFYAKPNSYIRDPWNKLDFVIVLISCCTMTLELLVNNDQVGLTAIRTFRVLRPLKAVTHVKGLQLIITVLLRSLGQLADVLCLYFFFVVVTGIVAVQFWHGKLKYRCRPDLTLNAKITLLDDPSRTCKPGATVSFGYHCPWGYSCVTVDNPNYGQTSFDNLGVSILTMFTLVTMEGWVSVMYNAMDSSHASAAIFFVLVILFGSFFVSNLALVTINTIFFSTREAELEQTVSVIQVQDSSQLGPVTLQKRLSSEGGASPYQHVFGRLREKLRSVVSNKFFDHFITITIVLNTIVMASVHHKQPSEIEKIDHTSNIVFTTIFVAEVLLKLTAFPIKKYIRSRNNLFDLFVSLTSLLDIVILSHQRDGQRSGISVFRAFRLLRVFKLAKQFPNMWLTITAIGKSLQGVMFLTLLLALVLVIYAQLGMHLFGSRFCGLLPSSQYEYSSDDFCENLPRENFDTLGWALLTVFQVITAEDWNTIMYNGMRSRGNPVLFSLYFVSLFILGNYIVLNLFIAVLLNNCDFVCEEKPPDEADTNCLRMLAEMLTVGEEEAPIGVVWDSQPESRFNSLMEFSDERFKIPTIPNVGRADNIKSGCYQQPQPVNTNIPKLPQLADVPVTSTGALNLATLHDNSEDAYVTHEPPRKQMSTVSILRVGGSRSVQSPRSEASQYLDRTVSFSETKFPDRYQVNEFQKTDVVLETEDSTDEESIVDEQFEDNINVEPASPVQPQQKPKNQFCEDDGGLGFNDPISGGGKWLKNRGSLSSRSDDEISPAVSRLSDFSIDATSPRRQKRMSSRSSVSTRSSDAVSPTAKDLRKGSGLSELSLSSESRKRDGSSHSSSASSKSFELPSAMKTQCSSPASKTSSKRANSFGESSITSKSPRKGKRRSSRAGSISSTGESSPRSSRRTSKTLRKSRRKSSRDSIELDTKDKKMKRRTSRSSGASGEPRTSRRGSKSKKSKRKSSRDLNPLQGDNSVPKKSKKSKRRESRESVASELSDLEVKNPLQRCRPAIDHLKMNESKFSDSAGDSATRVKSETQVSENKPTIEKEKSAPFTLLSAEEGEGNHTPLSRNLSSQEERALYHMTSSAEQTDSFVIVPTKAPVARQRTYRALFLCSSTNTVRVFFKNLVEHPYFEVLIILLISLSTVSLAMYNPIAAPDEDIPKALQAIDMFLLCCFTAEALLRTLAYGFVLHPDAYLRRDPWNKLDFLIVVLSAVSTIVNDRQFGLFRMIRTLRPLRFINKSIGMKLVIEALLSGMAPIAHIGLVTGLIFVIFAILGVHIFKGQFYACTHHTWGDLPELQTEEDCLNDGVGTWELFSSNFNHVGAALLVLFEMSTLEGWVQVMHLGMDGTEPGRAPKKNNQPFWAVYFIVFVVFGSFFIVNLFIGVLIEHYYKAKEKEELKNIGIALSPVQKEWVRIQQVALSGSNRAFNERQAVLNWWASKAARRLCVHPYFDRCVYVIIALNVFLIGSEHEGQPETYTRALEEIDKGFVVAYVIELLLRVLSHGKIYFVAGWNRFDFVVVITSVAGHLLRGVNDSFPVVTSVFRVLRLIRITRVVRGAKGVKNLFRTLWLSLADLVNVAGLLSLLYFLYAVIGVNMFGRMAIPGKCISVHANFSSFGYAMLLLFRLSTGEEWQCIMADCRRVSPPYCSEQMGDCPNSWFAVIYFVTFICIVMFVVLNLLIAIILSGYDKVLNESNAPLIVEEVDHFISEFLKREQKEGQWMIQTGKLPVLMQVVGPPLGFSQEHHSEAIQVNKRKAAHVWRRLRETKDSTVHFSDLMLALTWSLSMEDGRIIGEMNELRTDVASPAWSKHLNIISKRWDLLFPNRPVGCGIVAVSFAAIRIQQIWRGHKERKAMLRDTDVPLPYQKFANPINPARADSLRRISSSGVFSSSIRRNRRQASPVAEKQARRKSVVSFVHPKDRKSESRSISQSTSSSTAISDRNPLAATPSS